MTKLMALSLGILVILLWLTFAFYRKRSEPETESQLPSSELSLGARPQKELRTESSPAAEMPTPAKLESPLPTVTAPARELATETAAKAETIVAAEEAPAAEPEEVETETNIKPDTPPPPFDVKAFAVDTLLALPLAEKKKFLERNALAEPEKFKRFRYLNDLAVIDRFLKGRYRGTIEGKGWIVMLDIEGQLEDTHFSGELAVNLFNADNVAISRSATQGPLDSHVRIVEEGDKNSLLLLPSSEGEGSLYQIFIGAENRQTLAGNYYEKREDGTFERIGPFVLQRI